MLIINNSVHGNWVKFISQFLTKKVSKGDNSVNRSLKNFKT